MLYWILAILGGLVILTLTIAFITFYVAFYVPKKYKTKSGEFDLPAGDDFTPFEQTMRSWHNELLSMDYEEIRIKSYDGLTLYGKYYEGIKGAPVEILFHGYRGNAERDMCGGVQRCFALKRNTIIVDQRASGNSEGKVITFGIKESKDCVSWVKYAVERFGKDTPIYIGGISMGGTTVMMACGDKELPDNVVSAVADCGFASAKNVINIFIERLNLPSKIFYPFVRLGGILFAGVDVEKQTALNAVKNSKVPIIFFHGESDGVVPVEDSMDCFNACPTKKHLVLYPNTGHGMCYLIDKERYIKEIENFENKED